MNWAFEPTQAHSLGGGVQASDIIAHSSRLASSSYLLALFTTLQGPTASRSILCRSPLTASTLSLTYDLHYNTLTTAAAVVIPLTRIPIVPPSNIKSISSHRPIKAQQTSPIYLACHLVHERSRQCRLLYTTPYTVVDAGRRSTPIRPRFVANVNIPSSPPATA